jgi:hypothetical protein
LRPAFILVKDQLISTDTKSNCGCHEYQKGSRAAGPVAGSFRPLSFLRSIKGLYRDVDTQSKLEQGRVQAYLNTECEFVVKERLLGLLGTESAMLIIPSGGRQREVAASLAG